VEIQGTAEKGIFNRRQLNEMLDAADAGIETIYGAQRKALGLPG
jgi:ribonuclease PH